MENIKSSSLKSNEQVIGGLKEIQHSVSEAKEGYKTAAEATADVELKSLFSRLSGERIVYEAELKEHIALHTEEAQDEVPGILQSIQDAWRNINQLLSGKDDKSLLQAIAASERVALEKYETCISNYKDHADHMTLLTEQRDGIKIAVSEIEKLITKKGN